MLQQYLPLAVLKLYKIYEAQAQHDAVATVPTACGIETLYPTSYQLKSLYLLQQYLPLAVLKHRLWEDFLKVGAQDVATVPTACGIETIIKINMTCY